MKYNTIDYLYENDLHVTTGISFTINNVVFIKKNRLHETTVDLNGKQEHLDLFWLVERLGDLYKLAKSQRVISGVYDTPEKYIENLERVYKDLASDFHLNINVMMPKVEE